ncbi:MAG: prenyltransferase [Clostridiales Family XIII bacterium]|jgi:1,4-dihydroxy-2-naphthoate octaprenyltransferase|nr:prenyltransferase [Clostridiales Family XIII bacterium]
MKNNAKAVSLSNISALLLIPSELAGCIRRKGWQRLTPRSVVELAAPQTWGASVMPVMLAGALTIAQTGRLPVLLFFSLLATSVCLQCAVNTLNDYSDFMAGVDRRENCGDPTDASLIYHDYEPVLAFVVGAGFILLSLICGLYAIIAVGPVLLAFGAVGAAVVFLYSYGPLPLCYTPVGEALSGIVMGGIIPFACVFAMTGSLSWGTAVYSIPLIITIGLIMLSNNGSDIEKDLASRRMTLPARIGRRATLKLHAALFAAAVACAAAVILLRVPGGAWLLPLFLAWVVPQERRLVKNGLKPDGRVRSMSLSTGVNIRLNAVYATMILLAIAPQTLLPN